MMKISENYLKFRKQVEERLRQTDGFQDGNISWAKEPVISQIPIEFNNTCKTFFDSSSLPPSCVDVTSLCDKYVLYGIYCNGKIYNGETNDFGERMMTHTRDSMKSEKTQQLLYSDLKKYGECFSFVYGIADSEEALKRAERIIIDMCKDFSICLVCENNKDFIKVIKADIKDSKEYALKYCYNVI